MADVAGFGSLNLKIGPLDKRCHRVAASSGAAAAATPLARQDVAKFDAAKVARIAQAIRDGRFQVDALAITDKLIINAHESLAGRLH